MIVSATVKRKIATYSPPRWEYIDTPASKQSVKHWNIQATCTELNSIKV